MTDFPIHQTAHRFDLDRIRREFETFLPLIDGRNQLCLTSRPGAADPLYDGVGKLPDGVVEGDFSVINEPFLGTVFEEILRASPCRFGRVRFMRLMPHHCYSMHEDMGMRYHLAIHTNRNALLFFRDFGAFHVPADGHLYAMDSEKMHTGFNAGKEPRYHLLITDADCKDSYWD